MLVNSATGALNDEWLTSLVADLTAFKEEGKEILNFCVDDLESAVITALPSGPVPPLSANEANGIGLLRGLQPPKP